MTQLCSEGLLGLLTVIGLFSGPRLISQYFGKSCYDCGAGSGDRSLLRKFIGGVLIIFGARLAHGCTASHGFSGMGSLCVASFVMVMGMFTGAFSYAALEYVAGASAPERPRGERKRPVHKKKKKKLQ